MSRWLRWPLRGLICLLLLAVTAWSVLAVQFRLPLDLPWLQLAMVLVGLSGVAACTGVFWSRRRRVLLGGGLLVLSVTGLWWQTVQPSNQRDWMDEVAHTLTGEVRGDELLLHNVRNFHWRSETDYDIRWETRRHDLRQLQSADLTVTTWGMPAIAHIMVSFGFADGRFLAFSVETRKQRGEAYDELAGFFKEYELSVLGADERDVIRLRTNVRHEQVSLYRLALSPQQQRALLLEYVATANALARTPRFYHALTANCTTVVFAMARQILGDLPADYRILLTGYLPGYIQEIGGLMPGYTLSELSRRGAINDRALAADRSTDFSRLIRVGVPGWEPLSSSPH